jgi:hypothetical protein
VSVVPVQKSARSLCPADPPITTACTVSAVLYFERPKMWAASRQGLIQQEVLTGRELQEFAAATKIQARDLCNLCLSTVRLFVRDFRGSDRGKCCQP